MKSLEMELRKLQTANTDATNNFDERLNQLFVKKIKTEAVILQVCFSFKKKIKKMIGFYMAIFDVTSILSYLKNHIGNLLDPYVFTSIFS